MIRMEQPSFCFNSCDVGEPHYKMWKTIVGPEGMTSSQLAAQIFTAHLQARGSEGSSLLNVILNTHGFAGGLNIGGLTRSAMYKADLAPFGILKPLNIGPIWIVSCGAARDTTGKSFCQTLATTAGTQVIASDASQIVTNTQGIGLFLAFRWNIDDFEGTVYAFTPDGGMRIVTDPETDPRIMTVQEPRF